MMFVEQLLEQTVRVLVHASEDLLVHARHASRRFDQTLAIGVFANALQDHAHAGFDLLHVHDAGVVRIIVLHVKAPV